jgi:hypothetical protein
MPTPPLRTCTARAPTWNTASLIGNREQQLALFADRLNVQTMRANQLRLTLSTFAYNLRAALRNLALQDTELERATPGNIRTRPLRVGAQVRVSVRRVVIALSEAFPA